jgi:hypothetical protein
MAKNNLVSGPCEEMLKGVNVSTKPSGSPKTNGEPQGPKRTSTPNGPAEVTRDGSVGKQAKENVGGRS